MSTTVPNTRVVSAPGGYQQGDLGDGVALRAPGRVASTDGAFGLSIVTQPPGIATPLHRHTREAEAFYVLDRTITYRAGDELFELTEGSFIFLPRGVPHAFRIRGDRPSSCWRSPCRAT